MPSQQAPLHSGFNATTTATQAIGGRDLAGLTAIVTGGYSGLGLETTRALAGAGAHVVVTARRVDAARAAVADIAGVQVQALDLADLASVHSFAQSFVASDRRADIVICNAGIMACPETRVGPGWEAQFATNHLGHHALVNQLWPAMRRGTRVVVVSSGAHRITPIRWDDLHFEHGYDKWVAYGQSKTANALFAVHLDALGQHAGIRAFSVHPGKILTPLQRHLARQEMVAAGWIDADGKLLDPTFKTPAQGAATQVWAATSARLDGLGGLYCEDCDVAPLATAGDGDSAGVSPHAVNPAEAQRLWVLSAALTGVDAATA